MTNDTYNQVSNWINQKDSSKYWQERFITDDEAHKTYLIIKEHLIKSKKLAVKEPKIKPISQDKIYGKVFMKPDIKFLPNRYTANWLSY